jgi:chaperonin GroES
MLRPLGNRVLIRPEPAQDRTESGLWIQEDKKPDQTGTVVAVGQPVHPRKQEAEAMAERLCAAFVDVHMDDPVIGAAADLLVELVRREPVVKVGDFVMFSWQSGQELTVDGERYLLMPEDDLLAVLEGV